jgi:hypothetical protein
LQVGTTAFEVRNEHFDGTTGLHFADTLNALGKDGRAAVFALVTIDRSDDDVL